jgi:fructose-1,6-bisphosphatase II
LRAVLPDTGIDALMGTGGTPEGLVGAGAVRALGGAFFGRLDPQRPDEAERVREAGLGGDEWMPVSEIVRSENHVFCATGVTPGPLLEKVSRNGRHVSTQTLLVIGQRQGTGLRHLVSSVRPKADFANTSAD